jgi:pyruvate,water dikinase
LVCGKTASLGELFRQLTPKGVEVPDGFAITAQAYRDFLREAELDGRIDALLGKLDTKNLDGCTPTWQKPMVRMSPLFLR